MLPFTVEDLTKAVESGRVTARSHPSLPYTIFNYSPEVQFSKDWDEVTLNCRGLILDEDYSIVARPWKKFFNLGEVNLPIQFDTPVEIMDKADGSLGILYPEPRGDDGYQHYSVSTRGSFTSEQALFATSLWKRKYAEPHETTLEALDEAYTFLFEIIYPENRIVLNYGDMQELILLGAVQNENGYYFGPQFAKSTLGWTGPVVETFDYNTISDALGYMDRKNAEGYVIRSHNFLVKLKQPDYLDLHRLVTNASPLTVWEKLKDGKSKAEIVSAFPDEFHDYIGSMIDPLLEAYSERVEQILERYSQVLASVTAAFDQSPTFPDRKDFANAFKKSPDAKFFFMLLDSKPIGEVVWRELRPTGKGPGAWSEPGPDHSLA